MKTRMDKYQTSDGFANRSEKNKKLYDEVQDMNVDYIDIDVNNVIDLTNNDNDNTRESYRKKRELDGIISKEIVKDDVSEIIEDQTEENRVYDINEILKLAKDNKLFEDNDSKKRMINTEYNILTKLDLDNAEKGEIKEENLHELIDTIYKKEETTKENIKSDDSSNLLDDLVTDDSINLNEEVSKDILDKEQQEKNDAIVEEKLKSSDDDIKSMEIFEDEESSNSMIVVIVFVMVLLLVAAYLILNYFKII